MAKSKVGKEGESEFVLRVMDTLLDAEHRKLETIDPKKITGIIANLSTIQDEAAAMEALKESQRQEYTSLMTEIKGFISILEKMQPEIPETVRFEIENILRRKKSDELKALEAEREETPEPE